MAAMMQMQQPEYAHPQEVQEEDMQVRTPPFEITFFEIS